MAVFVVDTQVQSIPDRLVAKVFGDRASVGSVVTLEPRRRKFHRPITLTLPLPPSLADNGATAVSPTRSGIARRDAELTNLRLLCSLNGTGANVNVSVGPNLYFRHGL